MKSTVKNILTFLLFTLFFVGCTDSTKDSLTDPTLKKATGDKKAIELAKKVIEASGGKKNWDNIPYISFDYFGRRYWFWDKFNNRYRVESEHRNLIAAGTLDGKETYMNFNDEEVTHPDSLSKFNELAYRMWINDTYWLIFPFKLLDPGVKLKYLGNCSTDSINATCIELTFEKVGITPGNRYVAYIDKESYDVVKWDYYENADDPKPTMSNKWDEYSQYGPVRLSRGRGKVRLGEVIIYETLPEEIFTDVSRSYKDIIGASTKLN
ncbi:MAG: hypothetical protein ABIQ11_05805 [Saprospiraceae bacterium]